MQKIRKRAGIILILIVFMLAMLGLRVYSITLQQLSEAAERQAGITVELASARGTLYDALMRPLVNQETEYRVASTASPESINILNRIVDSDDMLLLSDRLSQGKPITARATKMTAPADGMVILKAPIRYSFPLSAPHVIGYLGSDGIDGVSGAELIFNDILKEASGRAAVSYTVDAMGRTMRGMPYSLSNTLDESKAGVALTIDMDIQKIAERAAKAYMNNGAVIVMKPETGHIAAMVSLPDYQPDNIAALLDAPDSPLLNKAMCSYNVGSVFKIVTAIAALESGTSRSTRFTCQGSVMIGNISFHCHNRMGHGNLDMTGAFSASCNPYYIRLAQGIGGTALYKQAVLLGFDRPVYIADGWKSYRAILPSEIELLSPAAVANLSFGQGALMATPLHIAQLVAAVVNDGSMISPTILKGTVDAQGELTAHESAPAQWAFSAETAAILREMMVDAVENGTGKSARPASGGAGGKTGTAETGIITDGNAVEQGWFAGFYPAKNPEYVIVVLSEDTTNTGAKAAPVFKDIGRDLSMLLKARKIDAG